MGTAGVSVCVRALRALISLNSPDEPHLGPTPVSQVSIKAQPSAFSHCLSCVGEGLLIFTLSTAMLAPSHGVL